MSKHLKIYARLSNTRANNAAPADDDEDDSKSGDVSVKRQLEAGHAFARSHPEYTHVCRTDDYVEPKGKRSGQSDAHRPRFRDLLSDVERDNETGCIWCYDLSRFSRGDDLLLLLTKFNQRHIRFETRGDIVDLDSFDGQLSVRFKQLINKVRALDDSRKQRTRIQAERLAGAWVGAAPQGLISAGRGKDRHLTVRNETYGSNGQTHSYLDTVRAWFELYAGPRQIGLGNGAQWLNAHGYRWRSNGGEAGSVTAAKLYNLHPANYRGVLEDALLDRVDRRVQERKRFQQNGRVPTNAVMLLHRILYCAHCGFRYNSSRRGVNAYYQHYRGDCDQERGIRMAELDARVLAHLESVVTLTDEQKQEIAEVALAGQEQPRESERKATQASLGRLEDAWIDGNMSEERYIARRAQLLEQIASLPPESPPHRPLTKEEILATITTLADTIRRIHEIAPDLANRTMRDIFTRIEIDGDNLRFSYQQDFKSWFKVA